MGYAFSTILFYSNNAGLLSQELKTESIVYEKAEPFAPKTIETIGKVIPPVKIFLIHCNNGLKIWKFQMQKKMWNDPAARQLRFIHL